VLNLKGISCKEAFRGVLTSVVGVASNTTLTKLETGAYYDDDQLLDSDASSGASRALKPTCHQDEFIPNVDFALLLNRAGRKKLARPGKAARIILVDLICNLPSICRDNRKYYRAYAEFRDIHLINKQYDPHYEEDERDAVIAGDIEMFKDRWAFSKFRGWLEERDIVRATYYFLRNYPQEYWLPHFRSSFQQSATEHSLSSSGTHPNEKAKQSSSRQAAAGGNRSPSDAPPTKTSRQHGLGGDQSPPDAPPTKKTKRGSSRQATAERGQSSLNASPSKKTNRAHDSP